MGKASAVRMPRVGGFTLIELMVTISVLAILITIAIPSFTATINRNRLATAANGLVSGLQLARAEAVRRGGRVVVCASPDPAAATPVCGPGSWEKWIVYLDQDGNGQHVATEPLLMTGNTHQNVQVVAGPSLAAAPNAARDRIVFRPDGLAYASSGALLSEVINVCIATTQPEVNGRNVRIRSGSAVLVEDAAPDPACGADNDNGDG